MTNSQLYYLINKKQIGGITFHCNREILDNSNTLFMVVIYQTQWSIVFKALNQWLKTYTGASFEKIITCHETMYVTETLARLDAETALRKRGKKNTWLIINKECCEEIVFNG